MRGLRDWARLLAPPVKTEDKPPTIPGRLIMGLVGVVLAAFLSSLDQRLASAAIADVLGGFGLGRDEGSWVTTAYAIGDIAVVPLTPWLAQSLSPRRVLAGEIILFSIAAVACPIAPSYGFLVAMRFLQGFGEGGLVPLMLLSLLRFAPASRRPQAFAVYALVTTLVPLVADPLAGIATDLVTWQLLFWYSAALSPVALLLVLGFLPVEKPNWTVFDETDYFTMIYLVLFACLLVCGLSQGQRLDWFDDRLIMAMFAGAGFFLAAFVASACLVPKPFLNLALFKRRNFAVGLGLTVAFNIGLLGVTAIEPQTQMILRGLKPLQIGAALALLAIPQLILAPLAAWLMGKIDARLLVATGFGLVCLGAMLSTYVTQDWAPTDFIVPLVMQACGWPLAFPALVFLTTSVLKPEDAMSGGTIFNVVRTLAITGGPALVTGIITVRERVHSAFLVEHLVPGSPFTDARLAGGAPVLAAAARVQAYVLAYGDAFGWIGLIALGGLGLVLLQQEGAITRPATRR